MKVEGFVPDHGKDRFTLKIKHFQLMVIALDISEIEGLLINS